MKVLLLGANGQLGSDLVRVHRSQGTSIELVPLFRKDLDVSDLGAIPIVLSRYKFDVLVNCTSYHKTDEVETHATEAVRINAHAVRALARACQAAGARFVHFSTDYVFGGESSRPYAETDCPRPVNVYGASKLLGENLAFMEYPHSSLILRVASLFGIAGASGKGGNFVETMLRNAREKGALRVVSDITMSPTATEDVAGVVLSLLKKEAPSGVYHVVNSGQATWFEFASEIVRKAQIPARVTPITIGEFPAPAVRPAYSVLDNRKATAMAGEIPYWKEALERYFRQKGYI